MSPELARERGMMMSIIHIKAALPIKAPKVTDQPFSITVSKLIIIIIIKGHPC